MKSIMTLDDLLKEYMTYPAFCLTALSDVNQIGDFGDAPLHLASQRGELEEMQVLINNGADIELRGEYGATPLHGAALMGKLNAIQLLLKYGANRHLKDADGRTPLQIARSRVTREPTEERLEIVKLLEAGDDENNEQ